MSLPRVLHLTRDLPPLASGGLTTAVSELLGAAGRAGIPSAAASFDAWRPRAQPGSLGEARTETSEHGHPLLRLRAPDQLSALLPFAEDFAPTVLQVHDGMLWEAAAQLREQLGLPALLATHVVQAASSAARGIREETLSQRAQQSALAAADAVLCPSEAAAGMLGLGSDPRCRIAGLGLEDRPSLQACRRARLREEAASGPVLYVGRFDVTKGTDLFLEAVPAVLRARPEARFVVAGGLPENARSERRWIRRWTRQAPPEAVAAVTFTGWLQREALTEQLLRAALAVVPSRVETFGLAAAEAGLHGVPLLCADIPALQELLGEEAAEWFPAGDSRKLAAGIATLLGDRSRREALSRMAAERIGTRLAWPEQLPAWEVAWSEFSRREFT